MANSCDRTECLVTAGADINALSTAWGTPLELAVLMGHNTVVKLLVDANALLGRDKSPLGTAYHCACYCGNLEALGLLYNSHTAAERKARTTMPPRFKEACAIRILHTSASISKTNIHTFECQPLALAARQGHNSVVQYLIGKRSPPDAPVQYWEGNAPFQDTPRQSRWVNQTAIFHAAMRGHDGIVRMLLQHGANVFHEGSNGQTVLHYAVSYPDCIRGIIDHCISIHLSIKSLMNVRSKRNRTALHLAAQRGHLESQQLLVDSGAELDVRDEDDCTALIRACEGMHEECAVGLIEAGADHSANRRGSALTLAVERNLARCVQALVKHGADVHDPDVNQTSLINVMTRIIKEDI